MPTIFRVLLSLCIFTIGLVVAAGMVAVSMLVLGIWCVRALWLKLTGRPLPAFTARFSTRGVFHRGMRRRSPAGGDVIDVEARHLP